MRIIIIIILLIVTGSLSAQMLLWDADTGPIDYIRAELEAGDLAAYDAAAINANVKVSATSCNNVVANLTSVSSIGNHTRNGFYGQTTTGRTFALRGVSIPANRYILAIRAHTDDYTNATFKKSTSATSGYVSNGSLSALDNAVCYVKKQPTIETATTYVGIYIDAYEDMAAAFVNMYYKNGNVSDPSTSITTGVPLRVYYSADLQW
jgi:hypothetical protein